MPQETQSLSGGEQNELANEPISWDQLIANTAAIIDSKMAGSDKRSIEKLRHDRQLLSDELERLSDPNHILDPQEVYSLAGDVIFKYNPEESAAGLRQAMEEATKDKPEDLS